MSTGSHSTGLGTFCWCPKPGAASGASSAFSDFTAFRISIAPTFLFSLPSIGRENKAFTPLAHAPCVSARTRDRPRVPSSAFRPREATHAQFDQFARPPTSRYRANARPRLARASERASAPRGKHKKKTQEKPTSVLSGLVADPRLVVSVRGEVQHWLREAPDRAHRAAVEVT